MQAFNGCSGCGRLESEVSSLRWDIGRVQDEKDALERRVEALEKSLSSVIGAARDVGELIGESNRRHEEMIEGNNRSYAEAQRIFAAMFPASSDPQQPSKGTGG